MKIAKLAGTAAVAAALGAAGLGLGAGSAQADDGWDVPWIPGGWNGDWNPGVNWGPPGQIKDDCWGHWGPCGTPPGHWVDGPHGPPIPEGHWGPW
jgi:hypothetical protein